MSRTIYLRSKMIGASDDNLLYILGHSTIQQSKLAMQELEKRKDRLALSVNSQVIYYRVLDILRYRINPLTAIKLLDFLNIDKNFKELTKSEMEKILETMKTMKLVRQTGSAWIDVRGGAKRY